MLVLKSLGQLTSLYLWWAVKDCWVSKMPCYGRLSEVYSNLEDLGLLHSRYVREVHLKIGGRSDYFQDPFLKSNVLLAVTSDLWESVSCYRLSCCFWRVESWHLVTKSEFASCVRGQVCFQGIIRCSCWTYTKICQLFPCNIHPQKGRYLKTQLAQIPVEVHKQKRSELLLLIQLKGGWKQKVGYSFFF